MATIAIKRHAPFEGDDREIKRRRAVETPLFETLIDPALIGQTPSENGIDSFVDSSVNDGTSTEATSTRPGTPNLKHPRREKKFICDYPTCGKAYTRPVRLAEHQRSHTNERPFVCGRAGCEKAFLRDSHLKHHIKSHHEDVRDFICDWPGCGKGFATGQRMRAHRQRHDALEQIKCTGFPPCEQYFRKPETLRQHILAVHLNEDPYVCEHIDEETGEACGRRFKKAYSLTQHREREHSGLRFICTQCSPEDAAAVEAGDLSVTKDPQVVGFATYAELQKHLKETHPPVCPQCGETCSSTTQLKAHIDIYHQDIEARRTIPCQEPSCDRKFTKKGNMLVHYKSVHQQEKFVCGDVDLAGSRGIPEWDGSGACAKGFATKAALVKHVRTQHLHMPAELSKGKQKRKERKARLAEQEEEVMSMDGNSSQAAATLLTGEGYELERKFACVEEWCQQRFKRGYDLELHLEVTHCYDKATAVMAAKAAEESIREQEALAGGVFWVGGDDEYDESEDEDLAHRLHQALGASGPASGF